MNRNVNASVVAGLICFVIALIDIIGLTYLAFVNMFYFTYFELFFLIGLFYIMYKTLWRKDNLTKLEWLGFSLLFIIFIFSFTVGFLIGIGY